VSVRRRGVEGSVGYEGQEHNNPLEGRVSPMTIAKVLAVYKTSPLVLVVESAEGIVLELSLTDMHGAGHRFSDDAWTSLIEEYQMFTCQPAPG
jgi:hypothetical protein